MCSGGPEARRGAQEQVKSLAYQHGVFNDVFKCLAKRLHIFFKVWLTI
jgi:hypothetical protein